jgi:hypothetical protein
VISIARLGGLHHRYAWREAAYNGNPFSLDSFARVAENGTFNQSRR